MSGSSFLDSGLSDKTSILGLRLWVVLSIGVGTFILLILLFLFLFLVTSRKPWNNVSASEKSTGVTIPAICKDIEEVVVDRQNQSSSYHKLREHAFRINEFVDAENEIVTFSNENAYGASESRNIMTGRLPEGKNRKQGLSAYGRDEDKPKSYDVSSGNLVTAKESVGVAPFEFCGSRRCNSPSRSGPLTFTFSFTERHENCPPSWGYCYTLHELKLATNNFAANNVLGKGGHGVVYQGLLPNGSPIAVKNLLNKRGQAEKEFRLEVETIGRIRHKNLVLLLGYCIEGSSRMLVYEYIDNGNLQQWLHGMLGVGDTFPWDSRMKIALQTARGLAYLHEDVDPKVVHRDVKSSNILLDKNWDAKISDFGLARLLDSGKSHVMTRVMGTFGYVAPEYASSGLLTERSDVYSFGVLMMEIITGKKPVDHSRPAGEVNLVDWMKIMIGGRHYEDVIDPRLAEKPSARALKRALLVGLKCVDPDADKRPTMGHVVQMLERDDYYVHNAQRSPTDQPPK